MPHTLAVKERANGCASGVPVDRICASLVAQYRLVSRPLETPANCELKRQGYQGYQIFRS